MGSTFPGCQNERSPDPRNRHQFSSKTTKKDAYGRDSKARPMQCNAVGNLRSAKTRLSTGAGALDVYSKGMSRFCVLGYPFQLVFKGRKKENH